MRKEWGSKNAVSFALRPCVRRLDEVKDRWGRRVPASNVEYMKKMNIPAFSGSRALAIVWRSLPMPLTRPPKFYARSVKWNAQRMVYEVVFVFADAHGAEDFANEELPDNYGDLAEDTWMEGDIFLTHDHEMSFDLRDIKRMSTPATRR